MSDIVGNELTSREADINSILSRLGRLSMGPLASSGIIKLNLSSDDFRYFTFGKDFGDLFCKSIYGEVLCALLRSYVDYVKYESNCEINVFSVDGLMDYIDSHLLVDNPSNSDYSWLCGLLPKDISGNNERVADAFHIVLMIEQSMFTDEERAYQRLVAMANDGVRREAIKNAFSVYSQGASQGFNR